MKSELLYTEVADYNRKLWKIFQTPTEVMEVVKYLIFPKDAPQTLFDGTTKTTVVTLSLALFLFLFLFLASVTICEAMIVFFFLDPFLPKTTSTFTSKYPTMNVVVLHDNGINGIQLRLSNKM